MTTVRWLSTRGWLTTHLVPESPELAEAFRYPRTWCGRSMRGPAFPMPDLPRCAQCQRGVFPERKP